MGDDRHKKSPPDDSEEDVTPLFREEAREILERNEKLNRIRKAKKHGPDYLICSQAELADEIGTSKRMVARILGPVKPNPDLDLVDRSAFLGRIRRALGMAQPVELLVPQSRAETLRVMAALPESAFSAFEAEVKRIVNSAKESR